MSSEQKDALMELCRVHVHSQVTAVVHVRAFVCFNSLLDRVLDFLF